MNRKAKVVGFISRFGGAVLGPPAAPLQLELALTPPHLRKNLPKSPSEAPAAGKERPPKP